MTRFEGKKEAMRAYLETVARWDCLHEDAPLRLRPVGGGATAVYRQCLRCGESVGNAVAKSGDVTQRWDSDLPLQFRARREKAIAMAWEAVQEARTGWYEEYLRSEAWQAKRIKVMDRAAGRCEGCGERRPTQVHHLTYARVGHEMLFDLVAVCDECHALIHESEQHGGTVA